ncbi:MAG: long-chain fatty acid--CoA ligase [Bacteroidia bacterium]|nr:long-chain fatty acid--CoA ligase [Bacteroidia bacterium]
MENISRILDLLERLKSLPDNPTFLNKKRGNEWISISTSDFLKKVNALSFYLLDAGFKQGDKISVISSNKPEWMMLDFACQQAGLVLVPLFPSVSAKDFSFIIGHAESKAVFFGDPKLYEKYAPLCKGIEHLYLLEGNAEGRENAESMIKKGELLKEKYSSNLEKIKNSIKADDLMCILYTSGTSGDPKGVMLSQGNVASNVMACRWIVPFRPEWKALSFLPLNHVYEHTVNMVYFYHNISIYYLEHLEAIGETAREIKPDLFVAVPRIFERVYERIVQAGDKLTGFKKKLFLAALNHAEKYRGLGENTLFYELKRKLFDVLIYSKWRAAIGGNVKYLISGGAALNPKLERAFSCAGITILQGYGLTETSPIISVNLPGKGNTKFGAVGPVIEGCQIKISPEDGEILMKGPGLMKGYYKNEIATREAIDSEGWLHTGDVGEWVEGKFLKITDRKKEIFKTSAGKYIAPAAIENKLKECPFVENCMVVGEYQKFASAIIIPNMANFKDYCAKNNLEPKEDILNNLIQDHIKKVNQSLADFEKLKRCRVVHDTWGIDSGELTPKLSLKRRVIKEKYKKVLEEIYQQQD